MVLVSRRLLNQGLALDNLSQESNFEESRPNVDVESVWIQGYRQPTENTERTVQIRRDRNRDSHQRWSQR